MSNSVNQKLCTKYAMWLLKESFKAHLLKC